MKRTFLVIKKTDSGFTYLQRSFESNAPTKDEATRELSTLFLQSLGGDEYDCNQNYIRFYTQCFNIDGLQVCWHTNFGYENHQNYVFIKAGGLKLKQIPSIQNTSEFLEILNRCLDPSYRQELYVSSLEELGRNLKQEVKTLLEVLDQMPSKDADEWEIWKKRLDASKDALKKLTT